MDTKTHEQLLLDEIKHKDEIITKLVNSLNLMSEQNDFLLKQNELMAKHTITVGNNFKKEVKP